jgi:hypothetical protein
MFATWTDSSKLPKQREMDFGDLELGMSEVSVGPVL